MRRFYLRVFFAFALWLVVSLTLNFYRGGISDASMTVEPNAVRAEEILELTPPYLLLIHALIFEMGLLAMLVGSAALFDRLLSGRRLKGMWRVVVLLSLIVFLTYGHLDRELSHWMGQRLTWSYVTTYNNAVFDPLTWQVLGSDGTSTWVSLGILLSLGGLSVWCMRRIADEELLPVFVLLGVCASGIVFSGYHYVRPVGPSFMHQIEPSVMIVAKNMVKTLKGEGKPLNPEQAVRDLYAMARSDYFFEEERAEFEADEFPLWRSDNTGTLTNQQFMRRPLKEKPDIIFIIVETWRGWETGFAPGSTFNGSPLLHAFFEENGTYFPFTHSTGYPSVNGVMTLHLGLWPDPKHNIITTYANTRTRSFTEDLRAAGYDSYMLVGINPDYDNLTKPLNRWYDRLEIDLYAGNDARLVDRFIERYDARDRSKPHLMALRTMTTHPPYHHPDDANPPTGRAHRDASYRQVIQYTDEELARLLSYLQAQPDWERTLVVVVGDHAQPTEYQRGRKIEYGGTTVGETWTALGIVGGYPTKLTRGRDDTLVSHTDIAPTLLSIVDLYAPNHFMGRDLTSITKENGTRTKQRVLTVSDSLFSVHGDDKRFLVDLNNQRNFVKSVNYEDVEVYGELDLKDLTMRSLTQSEKPIARWQDAMRSYQQLLREDRLMPQDAFN